MLTIQFISVRSQLRSRTKILIIENVCTGNVHELTAQTLSAAMYIRAVHASPQDAGYGAVRRQRGWLVAVRKDSGEFLQDPQDVYDAMSESLSNKQVKLPDLFWADQEMPPGSKFQNCKHGSACTI